MTSPTDAPWSPDPDAKAGLSARFGENVRLLRSRIHVSQEELGFRADVHRTPISLIESGQRLPRIGTALTLAAALEVEGEERHGEGRAGLRGETGPRHGVAERICRSPPADRL